MSDRRCCFLHFLIVSLVFCTVDCGQSRAQDESPKNESPQIFARKNLIAWCIVPFDGKKRGPAERAEMVRKLGLRRVAYDWRQNHVPTFEEEILQYKQNGIEFFAFWSSHEAAFRLFEKHGLKPQIWQTLPSPPGETHETQVKAAATAMLPLVERTQKLGSNLGLYNHGGWGGEPENMVAVCKYLHEHHQAEHVGIVYNLHHGHGHIDDFAESLNLMKPYLLCLNLNGMTRNGDKIGQKILPLGEGEFDVKLLKIIRDSKYEGPIGIIGHTQDDVEARLSDNLAGLDWILPQLQGKPAGSKPQLRTWTPTEKTPPKKPSLKGTLLEGSAQYRSAPITVECRATLHDKQGYNILIANDTKASSRHWELFSMARSGMFTAYMPGLKPDHVRSEAMICDGKPHTVTMIYEPFRVRLLVDGKQVADQPAERVTKPPVDGPLAIGQLVEGGLGCKGVIDWVRISSGVRTLPEQPVLTVKKDDTTLLLWNKEEEKPTKASNDSKLMGQTPEYSPQLVAELIDRARQEGDPHRGLLAFSSAKSACLSCHKLCLHGGSVGPELTILAQKRKPEELVESLLWPKRKVEPEFVAHLVVDSEGKSHRGYLVHRDEKQLELRDPTQPKGGTTTFSVDEIELTKEVGTLMPDNLVAAMSNQQLADLVCFLITLGSKDGVAAEELSSLLEHAHMHASGAVSFPLERKPLKPEQWPSWQHSVNRDRVYDFYSKQADHFRAQPSTPSLLAEYPGLDGGTLGHWGNQNDTTWANDRWNDTKLGSLQCGILRAGKVTVARGVCVRLDTTEEISVCFNPDTLSYDAVWKGGLVKFSSVRHGFMHGLTPDGTIRSRPEETKPDKPFKYHGFYRHGNQVIFAYRIGETEFLDAPTIDDGVFKRIVAPIKNHPLRHLLQDAPSQWPQQIETPIEHGSTGPYAVDTIRLPYENPWNALMYCGGHAFLSDGSALVCTMQGDVWRAEGFEYPSKKTQWRRFASGLHHALGMVVDQRGIFVLGRDQITRLHDLNSDGEADFYECFSNAYQTSPAGHDFICGLECDKQGNFYTVSGNQGLLRISADGQRAKVVATGFRNPDGLGILTDGTVTIPCSEGAWTPASMICAVRPEMLVLSSQSDDPANIPHFGYPGPKQERVPELPLVYLPRGLDNSSGGQTEVTSKRWGPLAGQLLHFSFGAGAHFLVLQDEVKEQLQGAVAPLPGEFLSGAHRGRFSPQDGQLYVTGMQGWGTYTPDDGCFQRIRYTGENVQLPTAFRVYENGVAITFSLPLDDKIAAQASEHFAQCWNYRYGPGYGSPEFSTRHFGMRGHDTLRITSAQVLNEGRTLFLEMPELQPVNQLHLRIQPTARVYRDLFITVHKLAEPFTDFPGYRPTRKTVQPHPILADLAMATRSVPNPNRGKIKSARAITIETGSNLSFATRSFRVRAGEPIALTLSNPDVVPHNLALVKPGTLERVGDLSNRLISDPEAALRHYIPRTTDVLAYTDVVLPREEFTIYFHAPDQPGRYPYLCTFPGHWKVMNGEMIVE